MAATKPETIERLFVALYDGDIDAALALTTEDLILDRTNSKAPWRGISHGHEEIRAANAEFRDPIGEIEWRVTKFRQVGANLVAIGSEISVRGKTSGITALARGGWLVRFQAELIAEAQLHQSFDEALLAARRRALAASRLYFVCEAQPHGRDPGPLLEAAIRGGVDLIQLREKAPRCAEEIVAFSQPFAAAARDHGALFFLNDYPELVNACDADGVHVGQDDEPVAAARAAAGLASLVGLSTHSADQFDAALAASGEGRADQLSAGPVWETPTKQGRPAAGLVLIEHAARVAGETVPWFAIGGIDAGNVSQVVAAGASRIVVVRAIRDAADPEAAARELRTALDQATGV